MSTISFKQFYLNEKLRYKDLVPPTEVQKDVQTYISKSYAGDDVYTRKTWRDEQGRLHREGGPASIITDDEWTLETNQDDILTDYPNVNHIEAWYTHGKLDRRDGGPAKTVIKDGKIVMQEWYVDGKLHRKNGPAHIYYTGGYHGAINEDFYDNGKLLYKKQTMTIIGGRRLIEYRDAKNRLHREDDKPAYILEPSALEKQKEMKWYKDGQLHRKLGPAIIIKHYDGKPDTHGYYIDGVSVSEDAIKAYKGYDTGTRKIVDELDLPDF